MLTAQDVMTPEVLTIPDDATLSELVSLLSEHMITGAPVVDESGVLVGVVSNTDVARESARHKTGFRRERAPDFYLGTGDHHFEELSGFVVEEEGDVLVRDIMTPVIFSVPHNASFAEMADLMISGRVHRVIVTNGKRVVGIVTTLDLLRAVRAGSPT